MLFRKHRGSLDDSMPTIKEVETLSDVLAYLNEDWIGEHIDKLTCEYYCFDARINWHCWIVLWKGQAVGFSNGQLF